MTLTPKTPDALKVEMETGGRWVDVGTLAWRDRRAFFQYAPAFVQSGVSLSPFKLPLGDHLSEGDPAIFEGLHGLFNDSLPDGWGRLLLDRTLQMAGASGSALTPLARLAYVGNRGMGALRYRPEYDLVGGTNGLLDLNALASEAQKVFHGDAEAVLGNLLYLGGSPGGARPKVLVGVSENKSQIIHGVSDVPSGFEHWMIKFHVANDAQDVGAVELAYAAMARHAGINVMDSWLFPSHDGPGYFGTKRFDRDGDNRLHVHTICGLLNADHRLPSLGYESLLKAARALTKDQKEVEQVFDRMVFNVMAHNRDDHTKNHAFMLVDGRWKATPAFDLTFSSGPGGEHSLDVGGNGRDPGWKDLLAVAHAVDITEARARQAVERVLAVVADWPIWAKESGVSQKTVESVGVVLDAQVRAMRSTVVAVRKK